MANKKNKKKNNKNKKSKPIPKSPPPTAESISDSQPSTKNPVSDSPPSPPSPLSPRPPLPPDFFKNTVLTRSEDMTKKMRYEAFDIADNAFKKHFLKDRDIAVEIKKEFDKRHGPHWHCIVGASYGSYITYTPKRYISFYMSRKVVLLFKFG